MKVNQRMLKKNGVRIPMEERENKALIMMCAKRKMPCVRSDSPLLWVPQQMQGKTAKTKLLFSATGSNSGEHIQSYVSGEFSSQCCLKRQDEFQISQATV